jgi:hypothetical protein
VRAGKMMQRIESETKIRCNGLISSLSHNCALVNGIREVQKSNIARNSLLQFIQKMETIFECIMIQHCTVTEI